MKYPPTFKNIVDSGGSDATSLNALSTGARYFRFGMLTFKPSPSHLHFYAVLLPLGTHATATPTSGPRAGRR